MKEKGGFGFGGATLIMLFSVLCLTIFAVLSLSSAKAELNLTNKYIASTVSYYAADSRATKVAGHLISAADLEDAVAEYAAGGMRASLEREADGSYLVEYVTPLNEFMALNVKLRFSDEGYSILSWELKNSGSWNIDEHIIVWDGN